MSRIYISGAISSVGSRVASAKFKQMEKKLAKAGHTTVNPMDFCDGTMSWNECMKKVLPELMKCETILMLDNWRESPGARIERQLASDLELEIWYE